MPVLLDEMLEIIRPRTGRVYFDGALGAGGWSEALLEASGPDGRVIATDLDPDALERSRERLRAYGDRFTAVHAGFHHATEVVRSLGYERIDGAALDLGLSSNQLEDPERGFSFRSDGPLDMRFDTTSGRSLAEVLDSTTAERLADIIYRYGEERHARKVARMIIEARNQRRLKTVADLADAVRRAVRRTGKLDPATRTFQALRIAVNEEIANLEKALTDIPGLLNPGARFCVVSYHSIEDRLVKTAFREQTKGSAGRRLITRKPIRPSEEEIARNPRSRSARLRAIEAPSESPEGAEWR